MVVKGEIELDPFVAKVDADKCSGCLSCQLICPYEAISMDKSRNVAQISEAVCMGCGTCVAACPSNAIEQMGFSDEQVMASVIALLGTPSQEPVVAR
jgi:heterodisulfide reductase subunit A